MDHSHLRDALTYNNSPYQALTSGRGGERSLCVRGPVTPPKRTGYYTVFTIHQVIIIALRTCQALTPAQGGEWFLCIRGSPLYQRVSNASTINKWDTIVLFIIAGSRSVTISHHQSFVRCWTSAPENAQVNLVFGCRPRDQVKPPNRAVTPPEQIWGIPE